MHKDSFLTWFPAAAGKKYVNTQHINKLIYSRYYYLYVTLLLISLLGILICSVGIPNTLKFFTNTSGSMNPSINTGSLTVVKNSSEYIPGDVITYYALINGKEEIITHRILRIGGNVYVTKGDANQAIDREIVVPRLIIGKVVYIIPYLGYGISFAKGQVGTILIIILPAFLVSSIEMYKIYQELHKGT